MKGGLDHPFRSVVGRFSISPRWTGFWHGWLETDVRSSLRSGRSERGERNAKRRTPSGEADVGSMRDRGASDSLAIAWGRPWVAGSSPLSSA